MTSTKKNGHKPYLTEVVELNLVKWCFEMQEVGLCITFHMLKCRVQKILKNIPRKHPFRDGYPRQKWWNGFKRKHLQNSTKMW